MSKHRRSPPDPATVYTDREHWVALLDFDGTISHQDVTDGLLRRFGRPGWQAIEQQWEDGLIGSRDCMTRQIAMLDMTLTQFYDHLCSVTLDPSFTAFLDVARARGIAVSLLSDGLAQAIAFILQRHGISGLPIYANQIELQAESSWRLRTPYSRPDCGPASAHCKCSQLPSSRLRTMYIGDGASDFCVAGKADRVFAKGRLADYCKAQGIAHQPIHDFNDVVVHLAQVDVVTVP